MLFSNASILANRIRQFCDFVSLINSNAAEQECSKSSVHTFRSHANAMVHSHGILP